MLKRQRGEIRDPVRPDPLPRPAYAGIVRHPACGVHDETIGIAVDRRHVLRAHQCERLRGPRAKEDEIARDHERIMRLGRDRRQRRREPGDIAVHVRDYRDRVLIRHVVTSVTGSFSWW